MTATPLPANAPFGALALDLDGTLLSPRLRIEPETGTLVRAAAARFPVCIVTGRMEAGAMPAYRACGLATPMVSYNGAKIAVPGQPPFYRAGLPPEAVQCLCDLADRHDWHLNLYLDDDLYVLRDTPRGRDYAKHYGVPFRVLDRATSATAPAPYKMLLFVDRSEHAEALAACRRVCPPDLAHFTPTSDVFVEALPVGCHKGAALARLATLLDVPLSRWVAVGDAPNDSEMLRAAGLGVAIAGSPPEVVAAADRTTPPLWPDGLGALLRDAFGF